MLRELIALEPDSRAWVYQANRELSYDELDLLRPALFNFIQQWSSHGKGVDAYGNIFHRRFIGIFADKSIHVSGCSIDASTHFIKEWGEQLNIDFFERTTFAFLKDETVITFPQSQVKSAIANGEINNQTFVFDNLVDTKEKFLKSWLVPFSESWHKRVV